MMNFRDVVVSGYDYFTYYSPSTGTRTRKIILTEDLNSLMEWSHENGINYIVTDGEFPNLEGIYAGNVAVHYMKEVSSGHDECNLKIFEIDWNSYSETEDAK
jgi:hypothetical protein